MAGLAFIPCRHTNFHFAAARSVFERNFQRKAHVIAANALLAALAAAGSPTAEKIGKYVAESALKIACAAHVAETAETVSEAASTTGGRRINARLAETVIGSTLLFVRKHGIGFADSLELFLRRLVARVSVRVILHRETAVGLLNFVGTCSAANAEQLVIVLISHCF